MILSNLKYVVFASIYCFVIVGCEPERERESARFDEIQRRVDREPDEKMRRIGQEYLEKTGHNEEDMKRIEEEYRNRRRDGADQKGIDQEKMQKALDKIDQKMRR